MFLFLIFCVEIYKIFPMDLAVSTENCIFVALNINMPFMKKVLFFGLAALLMCLGTMTSCGGDVDEEFSENLLGWWEGSFVQGSYNADSTKIVYFVTDSTVRLKFYYPYIVVRGKSGVGEQYDKDGITPFEWQIKYGRLSMSFTNHPERDLEIYNYEFPVDTVFEGRIDITDSTDYSVEPYRFHLKKIADPDSEK